MSTSKVLEYTRLSLTLLCRKKISKLVVFLGDYNNREGKVDDGQMMRDVKKVRRVDTGETVSQVCHCRC